MFVGRQKELVELREAIHSDRKAAVLIYGKRRIGKSTLISETARDFEGIVIEHMCVRSSFDGNLALLNRDISLAMGLPDMHFSNLEDIFSFLSTQKQPVLIVLDEYQYLKESEKKGQVDSLMQNVIDHMAENIKLVLCGSYISVMKELLEEENPLFGRFTCVMHIEEFDYIDASLFYPDATTRDKIIYYAIFGGSPYVLSTIDTSVSLEQNIKKLLIRSTGILRIYIENVMLQEIGKAYDVRILEVIGNGKKKYSDIQSSLSRDNNGLLSKQLKNLSEMETIEKIFPINRPDDKKKSFYVIRDNLMRFYFTFVFGNDGVIARIGEDAFYRQFIAGGLLEFVSRRFEDVALQYFGRLARSGQRTDILDIGSFWYDDPVHKKNGEFDCVLRSEAGYEFYECKFYKNPMTEQECIKEEKQLEEIPGVAVSVTGFVCPAGFDFSSDRYRLINGDELFALTND